MKPFILTPRAEQDVSDIWNYIADDSIEAADRCFGRSGKATYKLAQNPGIGHMREELADPQAPLLSGLCLSHHLPV